MSRHTWDTDMRGIMQLPMHGCLTPEACASSTGSHLLSTPLSCQVKASQNATPQAQHSGSQTHSDTALARAWHTKGPGFLPGKSILRTGYGMVRCPAVAHVFHAMRCRAETPDTSRSPSRLACIRARSDPVERIHAACVDNRALGTRSTHAQ